MAQERFPHLPLHLTSTVDHKGARASQGSLLQFAHGLLIIIVICYSVFTMASALLLGYSPLLGAGGMIAFCLILFLVVQPRWAIPLYILIAAPSLVLPLGAEGFLTRLYPGNLLLAFIIILGLVKTFLSRRTSGQSLFRVSLLLPLVALVFVGLISIIFSRIQPDLHVVYAFAHSNVPLILVNFMEILLLLCLPGILFITPGLICTTNDIQSIVRTYTAIGLLYALGTIFAGPLNLYSREAILGVRRPEVFGLQSSILGNILVLFTIIALGQALYTKAHGARLLWWMLTVIFGAAVIMSFGRTAWISLFSSVLIMIGFRIKNLPATIFIALLSLLLVLLIPGVTDFFNPAKVYGADRLNIAQDAIAIWQSHPYFGVGAGNFQFFDIAYGTEVAGIAHNQFLEVLAEMGVQGLLCLVWSLLAVGWFTFRRFQTAVSAQGKSIALIAIGYYVTIIVSGFFTDSILPSTALAGGTSALVLASYPWLLYGMVLTIPSWDKTVPFEADQPSV